MKILIDGRILGYFGPGEYVKNLIINLSRLDHKNRYIVIVNKKPCFLLEQKNFYFLKVPSFVRPYSPWEQIVLPYLILRVNPDVAYFPNFNIPIIKLCPYVVTIHDLIYILYPQDLFSYLSYRYARFMLKKAAELADVVITDSEYSRSDIICYLKVPKEKIYAVSAAAGECFKPLDRTYAWKMIKERHRINKEFILYVGNHHYHKNILALIDSYSYLKERMQYNLVITGRDGRRTEEIKRELKRRNLEEEVILPGYIPQEDLPLFYNAAACFVFPSLYEGFGLPPLEAMACGVPIIASNKGALPEVLGGAAVFIDPLRKGELRDAIEKVLTDANLRRQLREKGLKQAGSFSWVNTAQIILSLLNKVSSK